jgi:hypothetical protein
MLQGFQLPVRETPRQLASLFGGAGFRVALCAFSIAAPLSSFSRESTIYIAPRPAAATHGPRFEHAPSDADAPLGARTYCP